MVEKWNVKSAIPHILAFILGETHIVNLMRLFKWP